MNSQNEGYFRGARSPQLVRWWLVLLLGLVLGAAFARAQSVTFSNATAAPVTFILQNNPGPLWIEVAVPAGDTRTVRVGALSSISYGTSDTLESWGWNYYGDLNTDAIFTRGGTAVWPTMFALPDGSVTGTELTIEKQIQLFFAGAGFIAPLLVVMLVIRYAKKGATVATE